MWRYEKSNSLTRRVFKLQKKGNLADCRNWRGISLLAIPCKMFSKNDYADEVNNRRASFSAQNKQASEKGQEQLD